MTLSFDQIRKFFEHHHPGQKIGTRNKVSVKCRFHEDHAPSCTLFLDGAGGFHCNGCGARGNCFQFQAKIAGCSLADAETQVAEITGTKPESNRVGTAQIGPAVASYDYRDTDGRILFQKRRYEPAGAPKTFRTYRPDGDRWLAGIDPQDGPRTKRVLYNAHLLVTANLALIAEGEKDADNLMQANLYSEQADLRAVAVASFDGAWKPGQSPKWLDQYNRSFSDKHVIVFEDNDESGRTFSAHVAAAVSQFAASVRVVRFDDLPEKSDVSDFLATHTVKDLEARIRQSPKWSPVAEETAKLMFEDAVSFAAAEIAPVRWLVDNVVPVSGNGIICGDPKASKSFHATDMAMSLACGVSWLGMRVPRRVRTALVSREDSPGLTQRRIRKLMLGRVEYASIEGWMLVNTRRHSADFKVMNPANLDQLVRELKAFNVEFCVLDVFRSIHDSEENDNDQVPQVLEKVNRIQNECGCAVALVHHLSKRDTENIFRGLRGASAIHGWMEWGIGISVVNPDAEDKADFVRKLEFENKEGVCSPVYSQIGSAHPDVVRIDLAANPLTPKKQRAGISAVSVGVQ